MPKKKKIPLKKWWRVVVKLKDGTEKSHNVVSKNIHSAIQKVYDKKVLATEDWLVSCIYLGQPTL